MNKNRKFKTDNLDIMSFTNGLVFFAPVALLVRTVAGLSLEQFFVLQAVLSVIVFIFEIPTGKITDRLGYKNTLVLSQITLFAARILLLAAFQSGSYLLFLLEAFIEGISACFSSGTTSAYLYRQYEEKEYVVKCARIGNFGTAGFIISTITYAAIYHVWGLRGLLWATVFSGLAGVLASLGIEKEKRSEEKMPEKDAKRVKKLAMNPENIMIVLVLACISISFILINFFYVDKLQILGISEEWMTGIILGYSAVSMLAEKLLDRIDSRKFLLTFAVGFVLSGIMMVLFGCINKIVIAIPIMILLPLVVTLPAYIFDEIENKVIDKNGQEASRAEVLSIYNMGVNFVEVLFLFGSAFLSRAGMSISFAVTGILLGVIGVLGFMVFGTQYAE